MTVFEDIAGLASPLTALLAGLVTSLHCVGMCGPLACAGLGIGEVGAKLSLAFGFYHTARLLSYTVIGSVAGGLGAGFVEWVGATPAKVVPIALAFFFLSIVVGFEGIAARIKFLNRFSHRLMRWAYSISGWKRGLALGFATPLLPCGPLYLMFWVAALSGSSVSGAMILGVFGLGTVPALLASQLGFDWLSKRVGPVKLRFWKRGLALVAMGLVLIRFGLDLDFASLAFGESICH